MVSEGLALAYRRYSLDYVDEEADARTEPRGIWTSDFVKPWEWRRDTQRPYTNVKIRQRGRIRHGEVFAQSAARNALDALTNAGVPEAALVSVEIYGIEGLGQFAGGGPPQFYDVWVRVAECPSRVFFKAQAAGTIFEMNDKADCVAIAKAVEGLGN